MAGTPRKTTARKTAQKKAAPRRRAEPARSGPAIERIDLVDELGTQPAEPAAITLLGVDAAVRRGYTGAEVLQFYKMLEEADFEGMLSLVTDNGAALYGAIGGLPTKHASSVLNRIVALTGLHEGEMFAPLPGFVPPAGARTSPESDADTD